MLELWQTAGIREKHCVRWSEIKNDRDQFVTYVGVYAYAKDQHDNVTTWSVAFFDDKLDSIASYFPTRKQAEAAYVSVVLGVCALGGKFDKTDVPEDQIASAANGNVRTSASKFYSNKSKWKPSK